MSTLPDRPPAGHDIDWPNLPPAPPESAHAELRRLQADRDWGKQALTKGTPEHTQREALLARVLTEQEQGVAPPVTDPQSYYLGTTEPALPVRDWLSLAGFDKANGENFAKLVEQRAGTWGTLDPAKAEADLRAVLKADYEPQLRAALALVADVERQRPGLRAFLEETGAGNDPLVIRELMNAANRRSN
jgi:hypothetical protein